MNAYKKRILQVLSVVIFFSLIIGVAIKSNGVKADQVTKSAKVVAKDNQDTTKIKELAVNKQDEQSEDVAAMARSYVAESSETLEEKGVATGEGKAVLYKAEDDDNYVIYVLARVINNTDSTDKQRFRCVINKNESGAETGLVDIVLDANTVPLIDVEYDMDIEEYKADVKVNRAGEWIRTGEYYEVIFDDVNTIEGNVTKEIMAKAIGSADETDIDNWKQGRSLNSTFIADMEVIKNSEPSEIYNEICNKYQYTWTFEQIETFKAYVESLSGESKDKWLQTVSESGLTLGY